MREARAMVCVLATGAAALATPACAGADSETLTLDITGYIKPACNIVLPTRHSVGELSRAGETAIAFSLDCNQRVAFALNSEEGGLRHETARSYIVPYYARLELLGDAAGVGRDIDSAEIQAHAAIDPVSEAIPYDEPGRLVIHWDDPNQTLASGAYRDVLTITLVLDGP